MEKYICIIYIIKNKMSQSDETTIKKYIDEVDSGEKEEVVSYLEENCKTNELR